MRVPIVTGEDVVLVVAVCGFDKIDERSVAGDCSDELQDQDGGLLNQSHRDKSHNMPARNPAAQLFVFTLAPCVRCLRLP